MSWLCYGTTGLIFVFLLFSLLSLGSALLRAANRRITIAEAIGLLVVFAVSSGIVIYLWSVLPPDRCLSTLGV